MFVAHPSHIFIHYDGPWPGPNIAQRALILLLRKKKYEIIFPQTEVKRLGKCVCCVRKRLISTNTSIFLLLSITFNEFHLATSLQPGNAFLSLDRRLARNKRSLWPLPSSSIGSSQPSCGAGRPASDAVWMKIHQSNVKSSNIAINEVNPKNEWYQINPCDSQLITTQALSTTTLDAENLTCIYLSECLNLIYHVTLTPFRMEAIVTLSSDEKPCFSCHYRSPST